MKEIGEFFFKKRRPHLVRAPKPVQKDRLRGKRSALLAVAALGLINAEKEHNISKPVSEFIVETAQRMFSREASAEMNASKEAFQPSERFSEASRAYKVLYGVMDKNQALFIDQYGQPIGEPRTVQLKKDKSRIEQSWLDAQRKEICEADSSILCAPSEEWPRQLNLRKALRGEADGYTFLDIIKRYGNEFVKDIPGVEGPQEGSHLTLIQYLKEYIKDSLTMKSAVARDELSKYATAIVGQESNFANASTSPVGAQRAIQVMPGTLTHHKYDIEVDGDLMYFRNQVPIMGEVLSGKYKELERTAGEQYRTIGEEYFGGDPDALERYFKVPMAINAYNCGEGRMQQVLDWFLSKYPKRSDFEAVHGKYTGTTGYDLFLAMTQEAYLTNAVEGYGEDSSSYWIGIMGLFKAMEEANLYTK